MSQPHIEVRWMIRRDMPAALSIDEQCFGDDRWTETYLVHLLRERQVIAMVAERGDEIVGYLVYRRQGETFDLMRLGVTPAARRLGVGRSLISRLVNRMACEPKRRMIVEVHESRLDAQLFLRSQGFVVASVLKDFYTDGWDMYLMEHRPSAAAAVRVVKSTEASDA